MNRSSLSRHALALSLLTVLSNQADALMITREFSGSWYDPAKVGQGFNIEIAESGSKTAVIYWYTFDQQGAPIWLFGQAPVGVATRVGITMFEVRGPQFAQNSDVNQMRLEPWGTLDLSFLDCNNAVASFGGPFGSGSMSLVRLTKGFGANCTGTLVDDGAASATAMSVVSSANGSASQSSNSADSVIRLLQPTSIAPAASGKLKYRTAGGRIHFSVEAEDVPAGSYEVVGGDTRRATLVVAPIPGGSNGEIEFVSPAEAGDLPLDFDPRGMRFEIRQGSALYLSGILDLGASGGTGGTGGTPPPAGAPPFGNASYYARLSGAAGKAELEQRSDRVDFKVEIENVAAGAYELRVAGATEGTVNVQAIPGGTVGELEFRHPVEPGKQLLDFDPRGQLVSLWRDGQLIASTTVPAVATGNGGGGDDGGNSGGGNSGGGNSGGGNTGGGNTGGGNSGGGNTGGGNTGGGNTGGGNTGGGNTGGGNTGFAIVPRIRVNMTASGPDGDAKGELEFESRADRQDFKIEVEKLDNGSYELKVAGQTRGTLNVVAGLAEIEFRNPAEAGHPLLDFEVLGKEVQVVKASVVYLRGQL